ncbi:MAG: tRNA dihydrouridine(20/20a) synthase DusA [Chromatiaceae bacterium]|nr:MAG: tRNA dihydrouridine(20/20a) synthase DusA [Chromatiaceae bacterium]
MPGLDRRLAVAPMLDWTDRHFRALARLLTRQTLLYTEMVTTGALRHGDQARHLRFDPVEHPLALQLGGADPDALAWCARLGEDWGYDEINLNVGCPSNRVQSGRFGACLMAEPELVAAAVAAMRAAVAVPVTVKTRIGIDTQDSYEALAAFTDKLAAAGCSALIVHARKAWLQGLSPRENREVPPLRYDLVRRLKQDFPRLPIVLNGGILDLTQARRELGLAPEATGRATLPLAFAPAAPPPLGAPPLDGVMIGRAAYHDPWLLASADQLIFGATTPPPTPAEVLDGLFAYVARELADGVPLVAMSRHLLGLFHGRPGAKAWRRHLSEQAHRPGAGLAVLQAAAAAVLGSGRE